MKRGVLLLALLLLAPLASAFGAPVEQDVGRTITAWDVATETGVTVSGDVGGNLLLFAPGEAEPESELLDENPIDDVAISADGERFVAISGKFLTLYGRTGGPLSHHDFAGEIPLAAAISPSGDYYAAVYDSGNIRLWWFLNKDDVRQKWEFPDSEFDYSEEQREEVRRGLNATSLLEMSSDYIAVAGKGKLYVVLRNDGSLKQAYPLDGAAQQLEISDDGSTLCLATQGSLSTYLFSGGSERSWRFESPEQDSVHAIGLAPDGGLAAVLHGSASQVVTGFTPDSSQPAWEFELEATLIGPALAVSDSRVAVAGWGLGEPDLLLLSAGGKLLASTVSDAGASSVQFGGGRVVTNSGDALASYTLDPLTLAFIDYVSSTLVVRGTPVIIQGHGEFNNFSGNITGYRWFLDGVEMNRTVYNKSSIILTNLSLGDHTITLQVHSEYEGLSEAVSESLFVGIAPVASANHWNDDNSPQPDTPVKFRVSASDEDGSIALYEWDFNGDGEYDWSSADSGNTSYSYVKSGRYDAVLRVTDNNGFTSTDTRAIHVSSLGIDPVSLVKDNLVYIILLFALIGGFVYWKNKADYTPPSKTNPVTPPPPTRSAPMFSPSRPITAIKCPGCNARMEVPKLGTMQKVTCDSCGLSGEIEV